METLRPPLRPQTDDIVQPVQETPLTLARAAQQASQVAQPYGQFGQRPSVQALPASVTAARPIERIVETLQAVAAAERQGDAAYQKGDTSKLTQRGHEIEHLNPSVRPAPVVAQPHVELASAIRSVPDVSAPPQLASTSAAAPTIQVTIGRIEVRATPPATSSARKAVAAPAMSLDDYLRARNGGSR